MAFSHSLTGIVAATHTPFHRDGALNLGAVEKQAAHLLTGGIATVFIGGTTGECHSLTLEERRALAVRWMEVVRGTPMKVIVHVGSNCLEDARTLATQAEQLGAFAISAVAPNYFKPRDIAALIACAAHIASAAPATAFYWYDIPSFTNLSHSMPEFLARAGGRVPTLAGVKFSNSDLMAYQLCLHAPGGPWTIPFGIDEFLLSALALGATSAVGSTYNVAAPIYTRLITAFQRGDLATAREEQLRSARLVQVLASYGFMAAMKALMGMLGVEVGPARLPHVSLSPEQLVKLRADLETLGFFDWVRP